MGIVVPLETQPLRSLQGQSEIAEEEIRRRELLLRRELMGPLKEVPIPNRKMVPPEARMVR